MRVVRRALPQPSSPLAQSPGPKLTAASSQAWSSASKSSGSSSAEVPSGTGTPLPPAIATRATKTAA